VASLVKWCETWKARQEAVGDKRPCFCPACNGELRNKKTVKSHLEAVLERTGQDGSGPSTEAGVSTESQPMLQSENSSVSMTGNKIPCFCPVCKELAGCYWFFEETGL